MNVIFYIGLVLLTIAGASVITRIAIGPSDPDRAVAADLLLATCIGLFIIFGVIAGYSAISDVLLAAATSSFLATLALARLILRNEQ